MNQVVKDVAPDSFTVSSGAAVVDKFYGLNSEGKSLHDAGYAVDSMVKKRDFDNFFGQVDRDLVIRAWRWALSMHVEARGGRRMIICIPRAQRISLTRIDKPMSVAMLFGKCKDG